MTAARLLEARGLPEAWADRHRHVLVAAGVEALDVALHAWQLWRDDPRRCERLHLVVAGFDPVSVGALEPAPPAPQSLVSMLRERWPAWTPDLHRLTFDDARVHWLLVPEAIALAEVVVTADTVCWTGLADSTDAEALRRLARACLRCVAADGTLVADAPSDGLQSAAQATLHTALRAGGFSALPSAGDLLVARRGIAVPVHRPARQAAAPAPEHRAIIVGAGLAGCATAWALAEHGWNSVVLERSPEIATEGSSQPAGVFHGIVHPREGPHARFGRAGALAAHDVIAAAIERHGVRGHAGGMLRLLERDTDVASARAVLDALGLPPAHVQALDAAAASHLAGMPLDRPAWHYAGGGWVEPGGLCRAFLAQAGGATTLRTGVAVDTLRRAGDTWELIDDAGAVVERGHVVVLANAGDAGRLAGADWPLERIRGQTSWVRLGDDSSPRTALPRLPLSGGGYAIPIDARTLAFGATAVRDDPDPTWRTADHLENLRRLEALVPDRSFIAAVHATPAAGRVGWRWTSRDRLPLVGAVAAPSVAGVRTDPVRVVPRMPGLFVHAALGSRGLTWCALGAQVVAALVADAPVPIDARLLDAVDPARFAVRARRRAGHA
jgi:tRNA 5-methylaminomethyl-2-thiouridine biosynthesis bifunctional protein